MSRKQTLASVLLVVVALAGYLGLQACGSSSPTKPTGSIGLACSVSPESGSAPLRVSFVATANGTSDKDGVRFAWNFGDGTTAAVPSVVKTYDSGGTYAVKLTATAPDGSQGACQKTIQVQSNLRIDSCSAEPSSGKAPLTVQFHSQVVGNGYTAITYAWDFGDGGASNSPEPAHTYGGIGNYTARLTASSGGSTAQCVVPIGSFDSLTVNCSASVTEGDAPLTVSFDSDAPGQSGCSYSWDFDDGWQSGQKSVTHRYDVGGRYYSTVTATCGARRGSCRKTIAVNAPLGSFPGDISPASNGAEAQGSGTTGGTGSGGGSKQGGGGTGGSTSTPTPTPTPVGS